MDSSDVTLPLTNGNADPPRVRGTNNPQATPRTVSGVNPTPRVPWRSHHRPEDHYTGKAVWLRAAILGACDGLVTVGALVTGIASASASQHQLLLSALSGMVAGGLSMAAGEYISVAQQADSERADVETERQAQAAGPEYRAAELEELTGIYEERGLPRDLAKLVAQKLTDHDAVRAHARDELGIDVDDHPNPMQAAVASMVSFTLGAAIPTLALLLPGDSTRFWGLLVAVTVGLLVLGASGAQLGGGSALKGAVRVLLGGWIAMFVTAGVGVAFGTNPAVASALTLS